jgi:hypothetical protein
MKKVIFGIACTLILASLFNSCTIEKRIYQDGYHVSWKHKLSPAEEKVQSIEFEQTEANNSQMLQEEIVPNVHSAEELSANTSEEITFEPKKRSVIQPEKDTVIPDQPKTQEEYFSNNYTNALPTNELQDTKLANWALGLGIASISAPVWGVLLFFLIVGILGASWSSIGIWTAFGIAILAGGALFVAMEILAITFAIRFLRLHAKDPNYRKYRSRAITGLILAGIYPALMLLNIIIGLAMI